MRSMGWTDQKLLRMMDSETHSAFRNPYEKIPQPSNLKKIKEDARRPLRCCNVCNCCCYLRKQMSQQPPPVPPSTAFVESKNSESDSAHPPLAHAAATQPPPPPPKTAHESRPRIRRECHGGDNLTPKVTETRPTQQTATTKKPKEFRSRAYMISEGVELVPLLAKRRAQQRSTSLSTTDVTKYREPGGPWQDYGVQYLSDLCKQMKRKQNDTNVSDTIHAGQRQAGNFIPPSNLFAEPQNKRRGEQPTALRHLVIVVGAAGSWRAARYKE